MHHDIDGSSQQAAAKLQLAWLLIIFLVASTWPYGWLIEHFGYDDILREPSDAVLRQFHEGGAPLVLAWFVFAMSALLFIFVVRAFDRLFDACWIHDRGTAVLGIAAAIAQATGLLRWVLVVPGLATTYADPASTATAREAVIVVFDAVHRYGGRVLGELVGQLLLAAWTALVAMQLCRSGAVPRWLASVGLTTIPFWLLGQTELLHDVVPGVPVIEVIPLAYIGWQAWLASLALALLIGAGRDSTRLTGRRPSPPPDCRAHSGGLNPPCAVTTGICAPGRKP